jgi:hypothetical protein
MMGPLSAEETTAAVRVHTISESLSPPPAAGTPTECLRNSPLPTTHTNTCNTVAAAQQKRAQLAGLWLKDSKCNPSAQYSDSARQLACAGTLTESLAAQRVQSARHPQQEVQHEVEVLQAHQSRQ